MNEKDLNGIIEAVMRDLADVSSITLDMALALAEAVRKKASEIGVKAVVAVSNRGANTILVQCMYAAHGHTLFLGAAVIVLVFHLKEGIA